jgi:hypothetical protein
VLFVTATSTAIRANITVQATMMARAKGRARPGLSRLRCVKLRVTAVLEATPPSKPSRAMLFLAPTTLFKA